MSTPKDMHEELMRLADDYAESRHVNGDRSYNTKAENAYQAVAAYASTLTDRLERAERMFGATCSALGAINQALGLDPEDGGAEPILDAIKELEAQLAAVGAVGSTVHQYRVAHCADWYDGHPDTTDGKAYQTRTLYTSAQPADQPAPAVVGSLAGPNITLDFKMATELLEMYGGEPTEITLQNGTGHSGTGVYAYYAEIPEEGAEFLGVSNDDAIPVTQPQQIAGPDSQVKRKTTGQWESARVADYNQGWNDCFFATNIERAASTPKEPS